MIKRQCFVIVSKKTKMSEKNEIYFHPARLRRPTASYTRDWPIAMRPNE